jgi:glycosyltransferase involved in cell wall biosynthesis
LNRYDFARLVSRVSGGEWPKVPTGNGFCLYIRRELVDDIGLFDEELFPRGYGEENDFCMRAVKAGWQNIVDDRTLVYHLRSQSFKEEKTALMEEGFRAVVGRHPEYVTLAQVFGAGGAMSNVRTRVRGIMDSLKKPSRSLETVVAAFRDAAKPRILYVLHTMAAGGTTMTTADLAGEIARDYDCYLLTVEGNSVVLQRWYNSNWRLVSKFTLVGNMDLYDAPRPDYEAAVVSILSKYDFDLVHIRHLINHSLSLPKIARSLGIPVVLSFHDFWHICPSVVLIDDHAKFCGGECSSGKGSCATLMPLPDAYKPLKHHYVYLWRKRVAEILGSVDCFVTTSPTARDLYRKAYPQLESAPFRVVEHGRAFAEQSSLAEAPRAGEPCRVVVLGNVTTNGKGFEVVQRIHELDAGKTIEFHFVGTCPVEAVLVGHVHGPYKREKLGDVLGAIRPSFVAIFSLWAETYCHTLSEAWQCGIPVLGTSLGAVGERIREHGGGWSVDVQKPEEILDLVTRVANDPDAYEEQRRTALVSNVRMSSSMAADYRLIYKQAVLRQGPRSVSHAEFPLRIVAVSESGDSKSGQLGHLASLARHPAIFNLVDFISATPEQALHERLYEETIGKTIVLLDYDLGSEAVAAVRAASTSLVVEASAFEPLADLLAVVDERPHSLVQALVPPRSRASGAEAYVVIVVSGNESDWSQTVDDLLAELDVRSELLVIGAEPKENLRCPTYTISGSKRSEVIAELAFRTNEASCLLVTDGAADTLLLHECAMAGVPLVVSPQIAASLGATEEDFVAVAASSSARHMAAAATGLARDKARIDRLSAERGSAARVKWSLDCNVPRATEILRTIARLAADWKSETAMQKVVPLAASSAQQSPSSTASLIRHLEIDELTQEDGETESPEDEMESAHSAKEDAESGVTPLIAAELTENDDPPETAADLAEDGEPDAAAVPLIDGLSDDAIIVSAMGDNASSDAADALAEESDESVEEAADALLEIDSSADPNEVDVPPPAEESILQGQAPG